MTQTLTESFSLTVPTSTASETISLTLPTATASFTVSLTHSLTSTLSLTHSLSASLTVSLSQSLTKSQSLSQTQSLTLPAHDNYTTGFAPASGVFDEGQELRVSLAARLGDQEVRHFNNTGGFGHLALQVWQWTTALDYDCTQYAAQAGAPLYETRQFGMTLDDQQSWSAWLATAFTTFAAPHSSYEWVVCFKHTPVVLWSTQSIQFEFSGVWLLFTREGFHAASAGAPSMLPRSGYVFRSQQAKVWYHLPADPTPGQYVVVELNSVDSWNFTRASSACTTETAAGLAACAAADNLKIVPEGHPCTYENAHARGDRYLGSRFVAPDGAWDHDGILGVATGATAGGVGLFGTRGEHPLVEAAALAAPEAYEPVGEAAAGASARRAYVYVRLPRDGGAYDVCFSAREERLLWQPFFNASTNATEAAVENVPLWRKLYPCNQPACAAQTPGVVEPAFSLNSEQLGWTMLDLSPGTYGTIRVDAGAGNTGLNRKPVKSKCELPATRDYFDSAGGDQLRLVSSEHFTEEATQRPAPDAHRPYGSAPKLGCWYRGNDRLAEDGADMPSAVRDLSGDPARIRGAAAQDDAEDVHDVYGTVYVPGRGQWLVCYRKAGVSGWRVLPWHYSAHGVPGKWTRLEDRYPFAGGWRQPSDWGAAQGVSVAVSTPLVAGEYDAELPPDVRYFMNDTRAGTWGPVVVSNASSSRNGWGAAAGRLSALPWNLERNYSIANAGSVMDSAGSALRLVSPHKSCDYPGFSEDVRNGEASESLDGGAPECNNQHAALDCEGSDLDAVELDIVAYFVSLPKCTPYDAPASASASQCLAPSYCNLCSSGFARCFCLFKVCWRQGGFNWRILEPEYPPLERADGTWSDVTASQTVGTVTRSWSLSVGPPGHLSLYHGYNTPMKLLRIADPPTVQMTVAESREGFEAGFVFYDPQGELSVAPRELCSDRTLEGRYCEASGDVFRMVEPGEACDVAPSRWGVEKVAADTHLSLYCPVAGHGTASRSGLSSALACANDAVTKAVFCAGTRCDLATADQLQLLADLFENRTEPLFLGVGEGHDDVVPYDSVAFNLEHTAAFVTLPDTDGPSAWKLCYKQSAFSNWVVLNESWTVDEAPDWAVEPLPAQRTLLGGELQEFALSAASGPPLGLSLGPGTEFEAKLVRVTGADNDACANPPGGTQATPFGSSTARFNLSGSLNETVRFHVLVPHSAGEHWLCVRVDYVGEQALSWKRFGAYSVADNQVRWYVAGAGHLPMNQATILVSLTRCTAGADERCVAGVSVETFNTDRGADAAKVVPWTQGCHAGDSPGLLAAGSSIHVGLEGGGVGGVADLGPADGLANVADFTVTLPAAPDDARVAYKVCVLSSYASVGRAAWVEVSEAADVAGQVLNKNAAGENVRFTTNPSVVRNWTLGDPLLSVAAFELPGVVALAGASTRYVADVSAGSPYATPGLNVDAYYGGSGALSASAGHYFKLVQAATFSTREPPAPYTGAGWNTSSVAGVSCLTPGYDGTVTSACSDPDASDALTCPNVKVAADGSGLEVDIQLPIEPGFYLVCYKRVSASDGGDAPWLNLHDGGGNRGLWTVSPQLQFDAGGASVSAPAVDSTVLYDVRSFGGLSLSSWCGDGAGSGVACSVENANSGTEFVGDWVAVVSAGMNCPVTAAPAASTWTGGKYYAAARATNETAATSGGFRLPPEAASANGKYKVCLLKAGDWAVAKAGTPPEARRDVAKRGVAYQLWNRASPSQSTLGSTGFFQPSSLSSVDRVSATAVLSYNASFQFVYADENTQLLYSGVDRTTLPEVTPGMPSLTPVLRSGDTVDVVVQAMSQGTTVPFGGHTVEVLTCPEAVTWDDLLCASPVAAEVAGRSGVVLEEAADAAFEVVNAAPQCANGSAFGWPPGGLRQFLKGGAATFRLRFVSSCPTGTYELNAGCGVVVRTVDSATGAVLLTSDPIWLNVRRNSPDAVAVGHDAAGSPQRLTAGLPGSRQVVCEGGPPQCSVTRCRTHAVCSLLVMALYRGPREFAPTGSLQMRYALADYGSVDAALAVLQQSFADGVQQFLARDWDRNGSATLEFAPQLRPGVAKGVVFYNVSYGDGGWTRLAVVVERPQPTRLVINEVTSLDTGARGISATTPREPVPAWIPTRLPSADPTADPSSLEAADGSYLEALVPYQIVYSVEAEWEGGVVLLTGAAAADDLDGWTIAAEIVNVEGNRVCEVEYDPACSPSGVPACVPDGGSVVHATRNLLTTEAATAAAAPGSPQGAGGQHAGRWALRARLLNNVGCERFKGTAPGGRGCVVRLSLRKGGRTVEADLTTPVRVAAQTVRAVAAAAEAPPHVGVTVTMLAGAVAGREAGGLFMVDEFHDGDFFALVAGPEPLLHGGMATADGVRIGFDASDAPVLHPPGRLSHADYGDTWGAAFTLATSEPCFDCEFTFHTTAGAGPTSALTEDGQLTLTFTDTTDSILCSASDAPQVVTYRAGEEATAPFAVTVTAGARGVNAVWPRYWVFVDADGGGVSLVDTPGVRPAGLWLRRRGAAGFSAAMRPPAGVATLDALYFERDALAAFPAEQLRLNVTAVGHRYAAGAPGSARSGTAAFSCVSKVILEPTSLAAPRRIAVLGQQVSGAVPLCAGGVDGCFAWQAVVGAEVTLAFAVMETSLATGEEQVVTELAGGVTVKLSNRAVSWTCDEAADRCVSAPAALASGPAAGAAAFAYGTPLAVFARAHAFPSGGTVKLEVVGGLATPLRGGVVDVCVTRTVGTSQVEDPDVACLSVRLFAKPAAVAQYRVGFARNTVEAALALTSGSGVCSGAATLAEFDVVTYYTHDAVDYLVYDAAVRYTLKTSSGQTFVSAADPSVTGPSLTASHPLPAGLSSVDSTVHDYGASATFSFYGLNPVATGFSFTVEAEDQNGRIVIESGSTASGYTYAHEDEDFVTFEVADAPEADDECLAKARFPKVTSHYRTYADTPGRGWGYQAHGGSVGVPFPIAAQVRTGGGRRALSFAPALVVVSSVAATGCNDGGTLSLYRIAPSAAADAARYLDGTLEAGSFEAAPAGVSTSFGQATLWPAFSQPCEACALELRLCYPAAAGAADCLSQPPDAGAGPILSERSKVTKPFTVRAPAGDSVAVRSQTLAPDSLVGALQTLAYDVVDTRAGWATPVAEKYRGAVSVTVFAVPLGSASSPGKKYANGAFLHAGTAGECAVSAAAFEEATAGGRFGASSEGNGGTVDFFFTRPCDPCEVWLRVGLRPPAGGTGGGAGVQFVLRDYAGGRGAAAGPGAPVAFAVATCGARWMLAGIPPRAVRRLRHFSVAVVRVDANNLRAFAGDARAQVSGAGGSGNGTT
eukprot:gene9347-14490_t